MNFWKCKSKTKFGKILKRRWPILSHALCAAAWPMAEMVTVVRAVMRQNEVTTCGVPTMVRLPALARSMRCSGTAAWAPRW
jgi:hypothetical protein